MRRARAARAGDAATSSAEERGEGPGEGPERQPGSRRLAADGPAGAEGGGGRRLRPLALAVAGYVALTALFHWPFVSHLTTHLVSDNSDGASFVWSYWYVWDALSDLRNPFVTDLLFHPVGVPLALQTMPTASVVIGAVGTAVGFTVAVNLVVLGAVVASAVGAYLLAVREGASRAAAFVAGAAFAFIPWRLPRVVAHHNLNHLWILPFGLLAVLALYDRPSRRRALVLGAVVGAAVLTDFTLTAFLLLATLVVALWRARETLTRAVGVRLLQAGAVAGVLALPLALAVARTVAAGDTDPLPGWGGAGFYSADLLSWVVPPPSSRFTGGPFEAVAKAHTDGERLAYPGLVVLALAAGATVSALRARRSRHLMWAAVAAVFFVLALGPFLKVLGHHGSHFTYLGARFSVPLPYFLLRFVPFLSQLRVPGRFAIVCALALDVLAALALTRLAGRRRVLGWLLPAAALVVVVVEFLPVHAGPGLRAEVPAAYRRIAADATRRAVLEVPLQWRHGLGVIGDQAAQPGGAISWRDDSVFMYYATRHHHPLVGGMVARLPARRLRELTSVPVYRQVLSLQGEPGYTDPATFGADDLRELGIGFVVYHRDRPMPAVLEHVAGLGLPVVADDGEVLVWEVPADGR